MFSFRTLVGTLRSGVLGRASASQVGSSAGIPCTAGYHHTGVISSNLTSQAVSTSSPSTFPAMASSSMSGLLSSTNGLLFNPSRSIMKIFWPRPRENKRIRTHGWKTRMSTPAGRRIIMRRILRGRHVLSH